MAYKPQYCPGQTAIAENRRKQLDPSHKLEKLRDVTDKDVVLVMGHRAPGSAYKSAHPPLAEQQEPACPIRKLVTPTDGAKAGDRVRYIQFSDSMYNAPCQPYQRSWLEMYRYRGIDPGTLSGRQIIECRERDLEKYAKELINTELFDAALTGIRGCTVHGHSLRLDENGMMFDMLQRCCPRQEVGRSSSTSRTRSVSLWTPRSRSARQWTPSGSRHTPPCTTPSSAPDSATTQNTLNTSSASTH